MKILPITPVAIKQNYLSKKNVESPVSNFTEQTGSNGVFFAYQDYNVNFTGRTPEDFYDQDFNRNNMPRTMKDYLEDDYENRRHIPPEQMMGEVYQYIDAADNLAEVQETYPNEDLFNNLHECTINARKGILSEIKAARDLSEAPLFKDGSDDFGMYLLKKIYLEGKTEKEISKDFLEKDINDEYKGLITEPVTYATIKAYGIKYPKLPFWNSFISTREEYKKFFLSLPKSSVIPGVKPPSGSNTGAGKTNSSDPADGTSANKPPKRRHRLNKDRKTQIEKDIQSTNGDQEEIERTVVKRFRKDDPEASFIVKYMSPIMTLAADKIQLSEEMRYFTQEESDKGIVGTGKTMFERFWKANPYLLELYSKAITDTIELFEDVYGGGGNLPINSEFKIITPDVENQKTLDYVSPEFAKLLEYSTTIEPKRNSRYAEHDKLQKQWEQHFIERYGLPVEDSAVEESTDEAMTDETGQSDEAKKTEDPNVASFDDELARQAALNNAQVFSFVTTSGEPVRITANPDEVFRDELKQDSKFFPKKYAQMYIRDLTKKDAVSDKLKLSVVVKNSGVDINDPRIFSGEEYDKEYIDMVMKYHSEHLGESKAAALAIADAIMDSSPGNIPPEIYGLHISEYGYMVKDFSDMINDDFKKYIVKISPEIDKLYGEYTRPLSPSEVNKISLSLIDSIRQYDSNNTVMKYDDPKVITEMLAESVKYKTKRGALKVFFDITVNEYPFTRGINHNSKNKKAKQAKCEKVLDQVLLRYAFAIKYSPYLVAILNKDVYESNKHKLSPETRNRFEEAISKMEYNDYRLFAANPENLYYIE